MTECENYFLVVRSLTIKIIFPLNELTLLNKRKQQQKLELNVNFFYEEIREAFHLIDKHSFDRLLFNSNLLSDDNKNAIITSTTKLSVVYS